MSSVDLTPYSLFVCDPDDDDDGIPDYEDNCPYDPENDIDNDNICGDIDNCPNTPNGPDNGTCVRESGSIIIGTGVTCADNSTCEEGEYCDKEQGDINENGAGDACECYADINGEGNVNMFDLIIMKNEYNQGSCDPLVPLLCCKADLNGDGNVNMFDLIIMKNQYGESGCPPRIPPCTFP